MDIREFCYFCSRYRSHSSMDRIQDSGSCDLGSSAGGITWLHLSSKGYDLASYPFSFFENYIISIFSTAPLKLTLAQLWRDYGAIMARLFVELPFYFVNRPCTNTC